jgi:hypothetical protein
MNAIEKSSGFPGMRRFSMVQLLIALAILFFSVPFGLPPGSPSLDRRLRRWIQVDVAGRVIGCNLTRSIFTEVGCRVLSFDYVNDGLTFDTITHGPQITTGIVF